MFGHSTTFQTQRHTLSLMRKNQHGHTAINPREIKTESNTKTCTQIFTVTLFILAPKWKQCNVYQSMNK